MFFFHTVKKHPLKNPFDVCASLSWHHCMFDVAALIIWHLSAWSVKKYNFSEQIPKYSAEFLKPSNWQRQMLHKVTWNKYAKKTAQRSG